MAEENNMTASEPTTEAPASASPTPPEASPSSTTDPTPPSPAPAEDDEGTLLTPKPDAPAADPAAPKDSAAGAAENAALFGVPEGDYEISGLPEGVTVDTEALAEFAPIAKELGLSNNGMSKVAAAYTAILPKVEQRIVDNLQNDIAAQQTAWANETLEAVRTDAAYGGKKLADVQGVAAKALDRFGGEEFRQFLTDSGLGNNPAMMKFAYLAGSAIAEDDTFERGTTAPTKKSSTEKFYGTNT